MTLGGTDAAVAAAGKFAALEREPDLVGEGRAIALFQVEATGKLELVARSVRRISQQREQTVSE